MMPVIDDIIRFEGALWRVLGIGITNEAGEVYLHLGSTTRFRHQRNGRVPVQHADFISIEKIDVVENAGREQEP